MTARPETQEFEDLYRRTRLDILNYLLRRTTDREDAADLLAEVYVVAWRRRTTRPIGDQARPWLFGVARHVLAEHARGQVRRREAADGLRALLAQCPALVTSNDPAHERREATLRSALATLPELDQELVTLTTWDGLSTADAAAVVGISAGGARVRLHRARSRLRARYEEEDGRKAQSEGTSAWPSIAIR